MSLPNTFDSTNTSQIHSPSSTQQQSQEIIVENGIVSNKHLTYAQIRGVIRLFNHHFPKKGKRMSREERNRRWTLYRNKMQQQYGRVIVGKLQSEKAYVKRYSKPLEFLKYKLKRTTNLKVEDLRNQADKDWYFEIGGKADVNELITQTVDVNYDSIERMTNNFENYNNSRRKRRRIDVDSNSHIGSNHGNHNHNTNNSQQQQQQQPQQFTFNQAQINEISSVPPPVANNQRRDHKQKLQRDVKVDEALLNLSDKLDAFEQELLDKKKIEMYEITKQKILAMKNSIETHFNNEPQLIGCLPGIENQLAVAFDHWMNKYKHIIKDDKSIGNVELLIDQLCVMKTDMSEWNNFLTKWKLWRLFHHDNFRIVWNKIKNELNIQDHEQYELTQMIDDGVESDINIILNNEDKDR